MKNGVQLTSWEALGYGISSATKKMLKWLKTNPAGWAILATTAIIGLVKGYDALIGKQEKLARTKIEDLDENISKYDEEIKSLEELQSKLESAKGSKSELAKIQNELNDVIGETADLLNGEGKAYDIANAKLKANIDLKKQQRAQAQKDKIEENKTLFDNNVYEDGSSWFNTKADSMRWYAQKYQELIKEYENALDDSDIKKMYASAEDYAFGWLNVNAGAGIKESTWSDYWDEQVQTAYDIFENTIEDYDGIGGQDFVKNLINNMTRGGFDLSEISNLVLNIIDNQNLQNAINSYWESLVNPEIDSEESLKTIKNIIDGIIKQYPQLESFFNDFYEDIVSGAETVVKSLVDIETSILSLTEILSGIQSLSKGLGQLDKIYADVKDGEYFDFSSILNNKEFTEAFSGLGESYENFIQTVTNSPDDIDTCQQAFNDLATAYIYNSGVLDDLTEETKAATIEMLKQMGVANAEEIVLASLSAQKVYMTETSKDLADATSEDIKNFLEESDVVQETKNSIVSYYLEKQLANGISLNTSDEVDNLQKLISALGGATDALGIYYKSLNGTLNYADISGMSGSDGKYIKQMAMNQAKAEIEKINASLSNYGVSYNGGSTSNKSSSSKDTKETFDWIETAISRLQRTITNFGKTVSATWKSWTDRNSALKSEISAVTSEINLQQQAADKYLSLANSISLSGTYKELVRNGKMDISTITNENTINAIKQFEEYYEAYLSALDAKQDAQDELASLVREDFDMIAKQFDSEISLVEANISTLEAYIDQTEMKGNLVSKNYYSTMYAEESKNLALLQDKYDELSNKLSNGGIAQGTEEWNSMSVEIKEVKQAIIESTTALEEYQKTMRELDWEVFDLIEEKIGNVVEESEFLIDLLSNSKLFNDDGSITSQGQATLGLHVANMKIYESQVKDYADELEKLDSLFANDSLDQNYLERRQELVELQREAILNAQNEQQSIEDLWTDGYSTLLDYMQQVIDKRLELLNTTKDLYDYEKQVTEQTEEIARLQNILNSYNGDTSEEAKASIQKYTVELQEAQEALEETEYERYLSDMEQMYNSMMDDAEEWQNARLDDVSGLLQDIIDSTDANAETIKTTLEKEVFAVGGSLTTEMQNLWSGADGIKGVIGGVNNTLLDIKNLVQSMVKDSNTEASKNASGATANVTPVTKPATTPSVSNTSNNSPTSTKAITVGGMINASGALIYDYAGDTSGSRQYYRASPYYRVLSEKNGYLKVRHQSLSSGTTGWFKKSDVKAYATGGKVDYTGLAMVHGSKSKPELMLNAKDTENFIALKDALSVVAKTNMFDAIGNYAKLPNFVPNGNTQNTSGDVIFEHIEIVAKDPEDFARQLKDVYDRDVGNVRKMINTDVHSKYGSHNYRRYL